MAAPNEAAAEKGTQVIKANLVCASVKLRIENFETLRSLTRMVESEEFSVPPNDACAAPITWQLELEFGDKIRAGEEMNPLYQLLVANQLRLKHKGQLPPSTKAEYTVQLIDGAEHTVKTVTKIIELHQHSESSSIALIHTDVQRALHADGALLVECSVRYLQPPLKPTTTASLLRYRPDDSTHREDLRQLSTNGLFSDFAIKVGNDTIPVHKCLLAQRSAVFHSMLAAGGMAEAEQGFMTIHDFEPQPIKAMLEYIYTGSISNSKQVLDEWAESLLAAAEKYAVLALKELVESHLAATINVKTLATIATLADTYSAQRLKEACADFVVKHHRELVKSPEWQSFKARKPDLVLELSAYAIEAGETKSAGGHSSNFLWPPPQTAGPYMPPRPSCPAPSAPPLVLSLSSGTHGYYPHSFNYHPPPSKKWYKKLGKILDLY